MSVEESRKEGFSESIVRNMRTVGAIGYYLGILPMVRVPALLPFVFATPFTILFILYVSGSGAALSYGLAGAITMTVAQQGLILGADLTSFKIEHKFQSIVVASPVSSFTYFISIALSEILFAALPLAVLLAIVSHDGTGAFEILEIIGVILLTWITTSSIGFFLSTYVLNTRTAFLTVTFISVVISVLPPVFYPLSLLPSFLRPIAELAPTTHASILIQSLTNVPTGSAQVDLSWVALPIFTAIFMALALFKARWRES